MFGTDVISIHQMHRDHVPMSSIPAEAGVQLLGSTAVCENQGFVRFYDSSIGPSDLRNINILTVQGHPEFQNGLVKQVVALRSASGVIDEETAKEYEGRKDDAHDGTGLIGKAIWGVLRPL